MNFLLNDKLKGLVLIVILFGISISFGHSEEWFKIDSPKMINGTGFSTYDQAVSIKTDSMGNSYYTGYFEGVIVFGTDTLVSRGNRDIFVCKIDNQGNQIWAASAGSEQSDYGKDLAINSNGEVYVTGYFFDIIKFGNIELSAYRNSDIFVAKLDSLGNWIWAKNADGSGYDRGNSIVVDSNNNSYVSGYYESSINFDTTTLNSNGSKDIFVAKLDSLGNWIWAKSAGSSSSDESYNINIDNNFQNLYITGYFTSLATFGATTLTSAGSRDPFIAKISVNGNWIWAKRAGSSYSDEITASFIDNNNFVYVGGFYSKSFSLDSFNLSAPSDKDIWLAKINSNGNWVWTKSINGPGDDALYSIFGKNNFILISGAFSQSLTSESTTINATTNRNGFYAKIDENGSTKYLKPIYGSSNIDAYSITINNNSTFVLGTYFGNIQINNDTTSSKGDSDIFLLQADSLGNISAADYHYGLTNIVTMTASEIDKNKDLVICGYFYGNVIFGKDTLKSSGIKDAFISKYSYENGFLWTKSIGGKSDDEFRTIAIDSSNNYYFGGSFSDDLYLNNQNYINYGLKDILILKTNQLGEISFVKTYGSIDNEFCTSMSIYQSNIAVAGSFDYKITFDTINLTSDGDDDLFVLSLSQSGDINWSVRAGGSFFDAVNKISTGNNSLLLAGSFDENADFGNTQLNSSGGDDMFVAKLNYLGNWIWAKSIGTNYYLESAKSIIYHNNSIYFAGNYQALLEIDGEYVLNNGDNDILIGKLTDAGDWVWKKQVGGPASDLPYSLSSKDSLLYLAFTFTDIIYLEENTYTNQGKASTIVVSIDSSGKIMDSFSESKSYSSNPINISFLNNNNFILSGNFQSNFSINSLAVTESYSTTKNIYLALYGIEPISNKWKFVSNTGRSSQIILPKSINPKIGNQPINIGDAVGVFYTRNSNHYCAGYGIWNDEDLTINVWGDNLSTLVKDGIADNEKYIIKAWSSKNGLEVLTKAKFSLGPDRFNNNTQSIISHFPFYFDTLNIILNAGWNLISSNIKPNNLLMDSVFKNCASDILIAKNNKGNSYIPAYNINNIGDWNIHQGYQVYAIRNTTLSILGDVVNPEDEKIILPISWSYLGYLRLNAMNIETALSNIKNKGRLLIAKNSSGQVFIPSYNINTIGNMVPGKGFQVYFIDIDTLYYPQNSLSKQISEPINNFEPNFLSIIKFNNPNNSTLILETDRIFNNCDIAVLGNNKIIGTGKIINGRSVITIYGNEEIASITQFADEGESLTFKVFNQNGELISEINNPDLVDLQNNSKKQYENNQIYKLYLKDSLDSDIVVSPNPARDYINIITKLDNKNINYEVYDINNKLILTGKDNKIKIESLNSGTYYLKILLNSREFFKKFVKVD